MAPLVKITEAELLDALAVWAVAASPDEAKTAGELADDAGVTIKAARIALMALKKQGRLVVHTVTREALDGRRCRIAGYTITPTKKIKRA